MIFHNNELLYLLIATPFALFIFYLNERKKRALIAEFGNPLLVSKLSDSDNRRRVFKAFLFTVALFFLILAAARPQFGTKSTMVKGKGVDIMIALDTSKSMYAEDVKPNRFEKAKFEIKSLIERLAGNSIGLIAFSGAAFAECPMTIDYGTLRMILDSMKIGSIPVPGTAIGEAIEAGVASLKRGRAKSKVLIVITDGEDHEGDPLRAVDKAVEEGVKIYTVGIGSSEGVPIPLKDEDGKMRGYKTDKEGKTVISRLNSAILEEIALKSGGGFFLGPNGISQVTNEIEKLEKSELGSQNMTLYEERFQYFVGIALLLLMIELTLTERKRSQTKSENKK